MVSLPKGTPLQDYTIVGVLGQGGFGITYLAEDETLERKYAIKEYFPQGWANRDQSDSVSVRPSASTQEDYSWGLDRFVKEAKTLARFRHPAIVHVNRVIEANGTAYMVLDYEDGEEFGKWLDALGRPPTQAELDAILAPLLDALALVHGNGILHRDISPDNIYIRADGTPVLLDFGAARDAISHRSRTISAIIKPGYSPAEQYTTSGANQGPWTDIYALGATLYRAVTGQRPQESPERAIDDGLVPAVRAASGDYRRAFLEAIDHALATRHMDRPQRVGDWRRELLGEADGAPAGGETRPRPAAESGTGPGAAARRPAARGRWKWAAIPAVAVLLGGGSFFVGARLAGLRHEPPANAVPKAPVQPQPRVQPAPQSRPQPRPRVEPTPLPPRGPEPRRADSDDAAWSAARRRDDLLAYSDYLKEFPTGRHAADARRRVAALKGETSADKDWVPKPELPAPKAPALVPPQRANSEEEAWAAARRRDDLWSYSEYLKEFPTGRHAAEARKRVAVLKGETSSDRKWTPRPEDRSPPSPARPAAPAAPPSLVPAPAPAPGGIRVGERYDWKLTSAFPAALAPVGPAAERFAREMERLSDGKIKVQVFPAGQLLPARETINAVERGTVDLGWVFLGYFQSKDPAFALLTQIPFGFGPRDQVRWRLAPDVRKIADRLTVEQGVYAIPCAVTGREGDFWSRRAIRTSNDLKGLKIRFSGMPGAILERAGATQIFLPGSEIVPALDRGVIDATNWSSPQADAVLGLGRVAKYYYYPGYLESGSVVDLIVSAEKWRSWPAALSEGLEAVCRDNVEQVLREAERADARALDAFKANGVTIAPLPAAVRRDLLARWREVAREHGQRSVSFKRLYDTLEAAGGGKLARESR